MTTTEEQYPIIIVGGGPAGIATALHLVKNAPELARQLLVIEAKEYPRPKLCGGGITIHGEEQLQALGVEIDVPAFVVDRIAFRLGDNEFIVPHLNAMRIIQRAEFDAALADAAVKANICIHTGERLRDIHTDDTGVTLQTDAATYRAKVVIGADGANSTVRRKLHFQSEHGVARLLRVMTPVETASDDGWQERTAVFDFSCIQHGIQGYMWNFPCYVDGKPHMNRGIFDSRILPDAARASSQPHGNLKTTFSDWLGTDDVQMHDHELKGHPVRWFSPDSEFSRPHVLLAGDAAGVDALFAEGISYAMEYGAIVAETVCEAFRVDDFSFTDYRTNVTRHRMGQLLQRRAWMASTLYPYRMPPFWSLFWRLAKIAPRQMQHAIGAWMALLPA